MTARRFAAILSLLTLGGCARNADWPVYQGSDNHDHYVALSPITPANVSQLTVAWTYDTRDAFPGSEMQSNPVIQAGVLYGLSPTQRAFALDAATGKDEREFWQRVEARNKETAEVLNRLGLAEYFAMEAYVVEVGRSEGESY